MDWRTLLKRALLVCICFVPLAFFMIWLPATGASAHETTTIDTSPSGTAQDTPAVDATVTVLQKEQLAEQVEQLHIQNAWSTWTNLATPITVLIGVLTVIGSAWRYRADQRTEREKQRELEKQRLADKQDEREKKEAEQQRWLEDRKAEREKHEEEQNRWLEDRKVEREKQAEARFQKVVEGLGSSSEAMQVGSAIQLRTFVRKNEDNERFYAQSFDLVVAHLRLRNNNDTDKPESLNALRQALVIIFKDVFPLIRDLYTPPPQQFLDAARLRLDQAYLANIDLRQIWMPGSSLRKAILNGADLRNANLRDADLRGASLCRANLQGADLRSAKLNEANLQGADLSWVDLQGTDLSEANLTNAFVELAKNLRKANLTQAIFRGLDIRTTLDFRDAILNGADFRGANLCIPAWDDEYEIDTCGVDFSGAQLWRATFSQAILNQANFRGANLYGADLTSAMLNGADLSNADLSWSELDNARLIGANLREATLDDVSFHETINWTRANLTGIKFSKNLQEILKSKGAIIDDDPLPNAAQPSAALMPLPQSEEDDSLSSTA